MTFLLQSLIGFNFTMVLSNEAKLIVNELRGKTGLAKVYSNSLSRFNARKFRR
jgi:hypothetical protein